MHRSYSRSSWLLAVSPVQCKEARQAIRSSLSRSSSSVYHKTEPTQSAVRGLSGISKARSSRHILPRKCVACSAPQSDRTFKHDLKERAPVTASARLAQAAGLLGHPDSPYSCIASTQRFSACIPRPMFGVVSWTNRASSDSVFGGLHLYTSSALEPS